MGRISSELDNIKIKKAKLDLQSSEITLEILKTQLLTKTYRNGIKKKTNASTRRNIKFTKT